MLQRELMMWVLWLVFVTIGRSSALLYRLYEAFKCFEKLTLGVCAQNPKLWYYMGVCAYTLNREIFEQQDNSQSDVHHSKLGYGLPHYVKLHDHQKLKRFVLAPKGDPVSQMDAATRDFELAKGEDSKKAFLEAYRRQNADSIEKIFGEIETSDETERSGRAQDKEDADTMQKLRALGYM